MSQVELWNKKQHKYDQEDWVDKPSIFATWAIQFFPPQGKLLEAAAGNGQDGRFFAKQGFQVTSTDFSPDSLEFIKSKRPGVSEERIEVTNLDLSRKFPFDDCNFDVFYCHLGAHYFDDSTTQKLFSEIKRILKENGIVALLVNSINDPEYQQSTPLGNGLVQDPQDFIKRFFTLEEIQNFTNGFETLILDDQGETYKDQVKGVKNLIRYIGKKK